MRGQQPVTAHKAGERTVDPVAVLKVTGRDGQVLHEGERITPDLVVQQIKLKAALLAFKSYRFAITF